MPNSNYKKDKYFRPTVILPIDEKAKIEQISEMLGMSVSEYLAALYKHDISNGTSRLGSRLTGFSDEEKRLLEKWQVPAKYYQMIENMSYSAESGYYIRLRNGYTNDAVGGRDIYCKRTADLRKIISKSHKTGESLINKKNGRTSYFSDTKVMAMIYMSRILKEDAEHAMFQDGVSLAEYLEILIEKDIERRKTEGTW